MDLEENLEYESVKDRQMDKTFKLVLKLVYLRQFVADEVPNSPSVYFLVCYIIRISGDAAPRCYFVTCIRQTDTDKH